MPERRARVTAHRASRGRPRGTDAASRTKRPAQCRPFGSPVQSGSTPPFGLFHQLARALVTAAARLSEERQGTYRIAADLSAGLIGRPQVVARRGDAAVARALQ